MEHSPNPGKVPDHLKSVSKRLTLVDNNGNIPLPGDLKLTAENSLLHLPGRKIVVVIKADLTKGNDPGIFQKLSQPHFRLIVPAFCLVGVNANGRPHKIPTVRQRNGCLAGGNIRPGV